MKLGIKSHKQVRTPSSAPVHPQRAPPITVNLLHLVHPLPFHQPCAHLPARPTSPNSRIRAGRLLRATRFNPTRYISSLSQLPGEPRTTPRLFYVLLTMILLPTVAASFASSPNLLSFPRLDHQPGLSKTGRGYQYTKSPIKKEKRRLPTRYSTTSGPTGKFTWRQLCPTW